MYSTKALRACLYLMTGMMFLSLLAASIIAAAAVFKADWKWTQSAERQVSGFSSNGTGSLP